MTLTIRSLSIRKKFQNKFHLESLVIVHSSLEHPIINQSEPLDKF